MLIDEIKKDIEKYELKASAMSSTIGMSIFFTVLFAVYILMPDVIHSLSHSISSWLLSTKDIGESENNTITNKALNIVADFLQAISSSREKVEDLKGTLTAIPVLFAAIFAGSYANYRLIFQKMHELNLKKHELIKSKPEDTNKAN